MTVVPRRRMTGASLHLSDSWIAAGVFVATTVMYLPALSPSAVAGDGGEFQMISQVLGVGHSTGYPLYTLLGWLFGHLPLGGDAAFRVTLMGTLFTSVTVAILFLLARQLGAGAVPSLVGALTAATAQRFFQHATAADVHSLAGLFMILGWLLLILWSKQKAPLWLAALAFGFGLTHHIGLRLLGPAVLIFLLAVDRRLPLRPRLWLPALACLVVPLVLYFYLPLRFAYFSSLPWLAGDILGVRKTIASGLVTPHYYAGGAVGVMLAIDYTKNLLTSTQANWAGAMSQFVDVTRHQFPLVVFPVALLGVAVEMRRNTKINLLLVLSYAFMLVSAISYLARVGEDGDHFLATYLLTAIWFAVGADACLRWAARRASVWPRLIMVIAICLVPLTNLVAQYPTVLRSRQVDHSRALLTPVLPQGAVIVGEWSEVTSLQYYQRAEGVRPDLWIFQARAADAGGLAQAALKQRIGFYVVRPTPDGARLLPLPAPADQPISHPAGISLGKLVQWRGYDMEPATPAAGDALQITLYWRVSAPIDRNWKTFIHVLNDSGDKVAQADSIPLGAYNMPPTTWRTGDLLADPYQIQLPAQLPPGHYHLIFGWYDGAERLTWAGGQNALTLAEFTVQK